MNKDLPLLPLTPSEYGLESTLSFSANDMRAYARAAIEAQSVPAPDGYVRLPTNADEADAMLRASYAYLHAHAPERLKKEPQAQPAQPLSDAKKAELDRMAKYVSTITQSEIQEADSDRGITKGTT